MNLILGGTHGLGAEIASDLRDRGKETFVVGRSYDEARHGSGMAVDLLQLDDVEELMRHIKVGEHALTGFFWVAGYGYKGDFADQSDVREMGLVNLTHPAAIAHAAWKRMSLEGEGRLAVISSTTAERIRDDETTYAMTKAGQAAFARNLGRESERKGSLVKVALFMPGGMQTPLWDGRRPDDYDSFLKPSRVAEEIVGRTLNQNEAYQEAVFERGSM